MAASLVKSMFFEVYLNLYGFYVIRILQYANNRTIADFLRDLTVGEVFGRVPYE